MAGLTYRSLRVLLLFAGLFILSCSANSDNGSPTPAGSALNAAASPAPTPPFPYEARGSDGRTVRLARMPARIVSLSPGTTESLFAIGAAGQVVAVDRFSDFPVEARARPKVDYSRPSIESLTALSPDLIIASGRQRETVPTMREAGLPVIMFEEATSINDVLIRIREFGNITGHAEEATTLAAGLERRIQAVTSRLPAGENGPRIYHEVGSQLHTATGSTFVGDFYTLLKARNIASDASGAFPQLSAEVIIQRDPEVILLADGREGVTLQQVRDRTGWSTIAAVRTGRVHLLPDAQADALSRPGPRVADGLEYLAKLLYPDNF